MDWHFRDHQIGPYILPDRLTGPRYLIFLEQVLPELLDSAHVTAATRTSMWFHQDVAPHISVFLFGITWMQHLVNDGLLWRSSALAFPIARPFLSGLFLLGKMKSLVYETPVNSAEELVARISAAAGEIRNTKKCYRMFDAP
ncbi:uncharacterized protein TNCV_4280541 [Trichonephila clavipes]|nr:uncharacterized protein TNCV_4280541 [Trichonephila clavipes]